MANGSGPKEKRRKKKYDLPGEQTGKGAAADEATDPVIEPAKKEPSDVKRSPEEQKTSGGRDVTQSTTEYVTEKSGDKKVKKRKKEKREEVQGDVKEQRIATNAEDGKKRKRKHKEDAQGDEGETAVEGKKRKKKRRLTSEE